MKKLIQICSVLCLVVAFSIISVNAQTQRFEANIPFEFNVAGKTFEAGKYFLKVSRIPTGKLLVIEDSNKKHLQNALVHDSGTVSKNNSQLRFILSDNQWVLSNLMTTETGLTLPISKSKNHVAKNHSTDSNAAAETFSVDLK